MPEYIDYVERGTQLRNNEDDNLWAMGDMLAEMFAGKVLKPGRPTADNKEPTLSDFARDIDLPLPRASERHSTADFYPKNVRLIEDLSWEHHNRARSKKHCGGELGNALELLNTAVTLKLGITAFKRYLNGEYISAVFSVADLSDNLAEYVPSEESEVHVTLKRVRED
jgi:hypothetical protein